MKYASDFRSIARCALSGRWTIAVIAGLIAALLGAVAINGPEIKLTIHDSDIHLALEYAGQQIYATDGVWNEHLAGIFVGGISFVILAGFVMVAAFLVVGSVVSVGYARFNLDLVDRKKEPELGALFEYFHSWGTIVISKILQALYVFLWSLLFVIPGIIAGYSYAMTDYILAEHPELTASEAISLSKQMMAGNRFRLFCLQLSFIGWGILCALTFGIGSLWLTPYVQAATAAFYREVSGTERSFSSVECFDFH